MTRAGIANLMGVSLPTVSDWIRRGLPTLARKPGTRQWRIDSAAAWDWAIEQRAAGDGAADGPLDLTNELARLAKARAEKLELENSKTQLEQIAVDEVRELWSRMRANAHRHFHSVTDRAIAAGLLPARPSESTLKFALMIDEALSELQGDGVPGPDASAVPSNGGALDG